MATVRPLKLPGAPDQELIEEGANRHSRSKAFGVSRDSGAPIKTGPLWGTWVMVPLEQAEVPDQEPMEPHGASRGSRSKDNGPLELGALNEESMELHRVP